MSTNPIPAMIAQSRTRTTFIPPPYVTDMRPAFASGELVVILCCADPRLDPVSMFGLGSHEGLPLPVVRNAGGRAKEAEKTLATLQCVVGFGTIVVVHHTDCGMSHTTDQNVRDHLLAIAPETREGIEKMEFGAIDKPFEETVREDLAFLRDSEWIKKGTKLIGLTYDTHTGVLHEVKE